MIYTKPLYFLVAAQLLIANIGCTKTQSLTQSTSSSQEATNSENSNGVGIFGLQFGRTLNNKQIKITNTETKSLFKKHLYGSSYIELTVSSVPEPVSYFSNYTIATTKADNIVFGASGESKIDCQKSMKEFDSLVSILKDKYGSPVVKNESIGRSAEWVFNVEPEAKLTVSCWSNLNLYFYDNRINVKSEESAQEKSLESEKKKINTNGL